MTVGRERKFKDVTCFVTVLGLVVWISHLSETRRLLVIHSDADANLCSRIAVTLSCGATKPAKLIFICLYLKEGTGI
jgi:hypothetical protein